MQLLSYLEKMKLNIASKVFSFPKYPIFYFEKIDIQISIPSSTYFTQINLNLPELSDNICITFPSNEVIKFTDFKSVSIYDCLNVILGEFPKIIEFDVFLTKPVKAGKQYNRGQNEQVSLLDEENESNCIHGLKRKWCAICSPSRLVTDTRDKSVKDIFDLIFPLLQPPLGNNFSNPVIFPKDKKPYPFQRNGIKFLSQNQNALLGDEMGLGKSIQSIVALRVLFRKGEVKNCLILCPRSVLTDWERKFNEWAPEFTLFKVHGSSSKRNLMWQSQAHIYLTTYETLRQDIDILQSLGKANFDSIILDEVQKIKNPQTGISKAVKKISASYRWGLSGTPLENNVDELVSIFSYLKPGLLDYYISPKQVKQRIKPYFLRRKKQDVLKDLKTKKIDNVFLELTDSQRNVYDKLQQEGVIELHRYGKKVTVQHVLALITRLKLVCNFEENSQESCKLEYLIESLENVCSQGDKALVFSQFPEKTLKVIKPFLSKFNPVIYDGSLSEKQRSQIVDEFQNGTKINVLLMSVKAGGLGITLTRANYIFHYDLWWNPAVAKQAEDRAHRIGQKKTVFVTKLLTSNTIEERIHDLLESKQHLFDDVIDSLSIDVSKVLSEEELFSLFNLKKEDIRKNKAG